MKYIYRNITFTFQSVILASKTQDTVGVRTFGPGATLELDYPGLSLYVPNILSCLVIGDENSVVAIPEPVVVAKPAPVVKAAKTKVPKKVKK